MAEVIYVRKNTDAELENVSIIDGQLLFTGEGHTFVDFNTERIPMQNTPDNEMSDNSINTVQNKIIKEYVDTNIETINNNIEKEEVWTNNNISSNFSAGTITLSKNMDNYSYYEILYFQSKITSRCMTTGKIPVGFGTILQYIIDDNYYRATATIVSGNTITFEDAYINTTLSNDRVIPYKVILYK